MIWMHGRLHLQVAGLLVGRFDQKLFTLMQFLNFTSKTACLGLSSLSRVMSVRPFDKRVCFSYLLFCGCNQTTLFGLRGNSRHALSSSQTSTYHPVSCRNSKGCATPL